MCYAYVYDTISRPCTLPRINSDRIMRHANKFARELLRLSLYDTDSSYLAILLIEAGCVARRCFHCNMMNVAYTWIDRRLQEIGDIRQVHAEHTRTEIASTPLRIRIPKPRD